MSLTRKIAHNTLIQFAGKIGGTIIALVTLRFVLRYLGAEGFGEYSVAVSYISIFAIVIDLGLYLIVTREISKKGADQSALISNILSFRFFVGGAVLAIASGAAIAFPYSSTSKIIIGILAVSFLLMSLSQILTGLFQKYLRMEKVSIAEVVGRAVWFGGVFAVIQFDLGIFWIAITNVMGVIANFVLLGIFSRKYITIKPAFTFAIWKEVGRSAAPLAVNVVLNMVYFKAGIFFLTILSSESEVGIFASAMKILENLIAFSAIYAGLFFPLISSAVQESEERLQKLVQKAFDGVAILAVPILVGGVIFAQDIMVFFGDAEFAAAAPILQMLMIAVVAIFFGNLFGNIVVALDKQKKLLPVYIGNAVLAIILSLSLIPMIGNRGAAIVTIVTEVIIALAALYITLKSSNIKMRLTVMGKSIISAMAMAGVLMLLPSTLHVLVKIAAGALVFLVMVIVTRAATKDELFEIFSPKKYHNDASH